jgi:hypothetical protein
MTGKMRWIALGIVLAVSASLAAVTAQANSLAQEPQPPGITGAQGGGPFGTGFTYQGKLDEDGAPHTGACDFQFSLWDADEGGNQIGTTQTETGVALSEGVFTVELDFGSTAFAGSARWLQIAVRCPARSGGYTTLDPRQALTAAPYALYAPTAPWFGLIGVPAGFADGVDNEGTYNRAAPAANDITTVDSGGNVGHYTSVTIGADGLGLISYRDDTNSGLKVLHCGNPVCSSGNTVTSLDSGGSLGIGAYTSVAIGADGLGLISYLDVTNYDLKVAHCSNTACTAAIRTTLDSGGNVGYDTSIAIGADGLGLISYYDNTNHDLRVAHCSNTACTAAGFIIPDSTDDVGRDTSIAIGADGLGLISYYDFTNGDLKVLHCGNAACSSGNTVTTLDSTGNVGADTSITIGADGRGLISYRDAINYDLKVAHCSNTACTAAAITTLDSAGSVGHDTSITIGADGLGLIGYYDYTNYDLKVAHCSDTACTAATITTLDSAGDVGADTSITIGTDGLPLISYYDATNTNLKVAHCSNTFCVPYFRRR